MTCPTVASLLGDSPRAVAYWVHRFQQKGLAGLQEGQRSGRPGRLDEKQIAGINLALRGKPNDAGMRVNLWDGKTLAAWIQKEYGIQLGVRQCQRLFRQLDFRLRKPRPVLAKAIRHGKKRQKKHRKLMKDPSVDLWALDEVHFQQQGSRCRMWIPPEEKDPVVYHPSHPQERRLLRRRTLAGRPIRISPRKRSIQRCDLLGIFATPPPDHHRTEPPCGADQ